MRIVDVCAFYAPEGGGVRTYIDRKLKMASAAGHEMVVLAPGARSEVVVREANAIVATISAPPLVFDRRYRYFDDERTLHRALDEWRPDIVEVSSPWSSASMVARWQGSACRSLVMHADPLSAYAYRWFRRFASISTIDRGFDHYWRHLRRLDSVYDVVVTASADLSRRLKAGGLRKVVTNPMGVEPGIFSRRHRNENLRRRLLAQCGLGPGGLLLVGVGRLAPEKRWGMVIDAVTAANASRPIGLLLIGEGRSRARLEKRVACSPRIKLCGQVSDRRALAKIMASADAFVHGCEAETFCMAAAEAKASGLPLIVPDAGGASDHVRWPGDQRYRAGDGVSLLHAILSTSRIIPSSCPPQRSIDGHFEELFNGYEGLLSRQRLAA